MLFAHQIADKKPEVGGTFGEAAHKVGIPRRAVRDIDAHAVALRRQLLLQVAADAVEQLKFVVLFVDPAALRVVIGGGDDGRIVAADGTELGTAVGGPTGGFSLNLNPPQVDGEVLQATRETCRNEAGIVDLDAALRTLPSDGSST